MKSVRVEGDALHIELSGWDAFWALRRRVEIPVAHMTSISIVDPQIDQFWKGIRWPGTHLPGMIIAGTYLKDRKRWFWYVTRNQQALSIQLENERFDELMIGLDDPQPVFDQITAIRDRQTQGD